MLIRLTYVAVNMPRNRGIMYHVPFISATYVWRMCDVCVAYPRLSVSTAYQRRTCGVSRVSTAYVLRMCYVRFAALEYV